MADSSQLFKTLNFVGAVYHIALFCQGRLWRWGCRGIFFCCRMQWLDLRSGQTFEHAHDLATGDHNGKLKVKQIDNRNMNTFDVQILIFTAGKTKRRRSDKARGKQTQISYQYSSLKASPFSTKRPYLLAQSKPETNFLKHVI